MSGEDDNYLYFTAKTPGFSPFAITGKAEASGVVNETPSQPVTLSLEQNNTSNATNVQQSQSTSTPNNGGKKMPGFEMFIGIVSLLAVFLYKRKEKGN